VLSAILFNRNIRPPGLPWVCGRLGAHAQSTLVGDLELGKKLYVGNLSYNVDNSALEQQFGAHGSVQSAQIIIDRDTGRSKGFGFVEMGSDAEAQAAISALNGKELDGRAITVNEARPQTSGGGGGGGGFGGKRGGGGRSGGGYGGGGGGYGGGGGHRR
jgi:RNA recognition motif-containing protein